TIHLFDLASRRRSRALRAGADVLGLAFSRDSRLVAAHLRSAPAASALPPALDRLLSGPSRRQAVDWLMLWEASTGRRLGAASSSAPGHAPVLFLPDGLGVLDVGKDGPPAVYDLPGRARGRESPR